MKLYLFTAPLWLMFFGGKIKVVDLVETIEVRKVGTGVIINYPRQIYCEDFGSKLSLFTDTFIFKKPAEHDMIMNCIRSSSGKPDLVQVDTRARIFIHYSSGRTDSLCIGGYPQFLYNNQGMEWKDRRLIKLLDSLPCINYERLKRKLMH